MAEDDGITKTYESLVNETVANTTRDEKGKLVLPEGTDEGLAFAVKTEFRRRDTQAEFTKSQQANKVLTAENNSLASNWEADAVSKLSPEDQVALEELKTQDPDAWRAKLGEIEGTNRTKFQEKRAAITTEAGETTEIERRTAQLAQYNEDNPDNQLTDDVIANDIPPRITKKLADGEIQFDEFLTEVRTYLGKGKAIDTGEAADDIVNLGAARGGSKPTEEAFEQQGSNDYKKEIF